MIYNQFMNNYSWNFNINREIWVLNYIYMLEDNDFQFNTMYNMFMFYAIIDKLKWWNVALQQINLLVGK